VTAKTQNIDGVERMLVVQKNRAKVTNILLLAILILFESSNFTFAQHRVNANQDRIILHRNFYLGQSRQDIERLPNVRINENKLFIDDYFLGRPARLEFDFYEDGSNLLRGLKIEVNFPDITQEMTAQTAARLEYGWLQYVKGYYFGFGFDICSVESRSVDFDSLRDTGALVVRDGRSLGSRQSTIYALENLAISSAVLPYQMRRSQEIQRRLNEDNLPLNILLIPSETLASLRFRNVQNCSEAETIAGESRMQIAITLYQHYNQDLPSQFQIFIGE
jgi:hypothetical protein